MKFEIWGVKPGDYLGSGHYCANTMGAGWLYPCNWAGDIEGVEVMIGRVF